MSPLHFFERPMEVIALGDGISLPNCVIAGHPQLRDARTPLGDNIQKGKNVGQRQLSQRTQGVWGRRKGSACVNDISEDTKPADDL